MHETVSSERLAILATKMYKIFGFAVDVTVRSGYKVTFSTVEPRPDLGAQVDEFFAGILSQDMGDVHDETGSYVYRELLETPKVTH